MDYTYPTAAEVNYFVTTKGMNIIRVPFKWERMQRSLNASLDSTEQSRLSTTVNDITSRGAIAIIEPHNYARYQGNLIGSGSVSYGNFADFWSRMSNVFRTNALVWFNLMNEPHDMDTAQWRQGAQAAIDVRAT